MPEKLICSCDSCPSWHIGKDEKGSFIICATCGDRHDVEIKIGPHEKLSYTPAA